MKKIIPALLLLIILFAGCTQPQPPSDNSKDVSQQIVEIGDTVKVEYRGELENGEVFDSSERQGKPLEFMAGMRRVIEGFDEAVLGMRLGDETTVTIPPQKAYGFRDEGKVVEIPKEQFTNWDELYEGMVVHNDETGANGRLIELKEDSAIVDFNHELAGETLIFWIKIVEIKKAQ